MNIDNSLIEKLKNAQHLVILTGAGISAESGIPVFQEKTELSKTFNPQKLGHKRGFLQNPKKAWGWYEWRRHTVLRAQPNAGHDIIAKLADVLPKVTLMTQNVDDLHERAGSQNVSHLHGSIHKARCIHCHHSYQHPETTTFLTKPEEIEPPKCEKCGDLVRPGVVWFEENLSSKVLGEAEKAVNECDLMFIIGTSGFVAPVNLLPQRAIERNITTVQINLDETELDIKVTFDLKGKAGEILPELYKMAF
jgi:NAD-dependent deacetylase